MIKYINISRSVSILVFSFLFIAPHVAFSCYIPEADIQYHEDNCPLHKQQGLKTCEQINSLLFAGTLNCSTQPPYTYLCAVYDPVFGFTSGYSLHHMFPTCSNSASSSSGSSSPGGASGCPVKGSVVRPEAQSVGESVKVTGTPFVLSYVSSRITSRKVDRSIIIPITSATPDPELVSVSIQIELAGRTEIISVQNLAASQVYTYIWDGLDASAQPVWGATDATIRVTEHYSPAKIYVVPSVTKVTVRNYDLIDHYVGGWAFNVHHQYEPTSKTLFYGNGSATTIGYQTVSGNMRVSNGDGSELYIFDSTGKHLSTLNGLKGTTKYTFGYDGNGRLLTITDAYSNVTTVARDGSGNPTSITAPYGQITTLEVNGQGYLTKIENPAGEEFNMTYFPNGLMYTFTNPKGITSTMTYDNIGRLSSNVSAAGNSLSFIFEYLKSGAFRGMKSSMTTAEGITTSYFSSEYEEDPYAISRSQISGQDMSNMLFDRRRFLSTGHLYREASEHANGMSYVTLYQDHPRFGANVRYPNSFTYTDGFSSGSISRSSIVALNNPSDIFDIDEITESINRNSRTTIVHYDGASSKFTTTSPEGVVSSQTVDSQEQVVETQYASFHPVTFDYDGNGRLEKIEHTSARPTELTYNGSGFVSKVTNALNEETAFTYDLAGRVLSKTLPDTRVIGFSYDVNGNLTGVTPPGKPMHDMSYNNFDLMSGYLSTAATAYSYNNDRQLVQITRPNSDTISYTYSSTRGRLTGITTSSGNYTIAQSSFGWDFPEQIVSPDGVTTSINRRGDNIYDVYTWGATVGRVQKSFNAEYNPVTIQVSTQPSFSLTYNNDNQLITVGDETLTRSGTHGLVTKATVGDAFEDYTYSSFGELSSIVGMHDVTQLYSASYTRDALGRVSTLAEKYGAGATQNYEYIYDSAGRLTDVELGGVVVSSYTYDSNSNRLSVTKGMTTTNATYTNYDQLITFGTKSYTYNSNGELIQVVDSSSIPSGVHSYTYDTFGNLKTVTLPNADVITYILDGYQRRSGVKLNGTLQKQYVWDGQLQLVAELNSVNAVVAEFFYGTRINVPDYMKKGGNTYKVITNHLGSVVAVVNTVTGVVAQEIKYDEFGNITSDSNPGFQPFGFAGGLYDNDTKLVHFNAREYDAETGRWLSKDPILFNGGDTNLYGYVASDPVNGVDPAGLYEVCTRPLSFMDSEVGPLYHQFLCVNGNCGGQGPGSLNIINGPGAATSDSSSGDGVSCKKGPEDKKDCMDKCIGSALGGGRPNYSVINILGGSNCQKWADDTVSRCAALCGGK